MLLELIQLPNELLFSGGSFRSHTLRTHARMHMHISHPYMHITHICTLHTLFENENRLSYHFSGTTVSHTHSYCTSTQLNNPRSRLGCLSSSSINPLLNLMLRKYTNPVATIYWIPIQNSYSFVMCMLVSRYMIWTIIT